MLLALGWIVVRASREAYVDVLPGDPEAELIDEQVKVADQALFDDLQRFLASYDSFDLTWQFLPRLNNHSGILHVTSSRNHRGQPPAAVELLHWVASRGTGSYGLVYLHDDEDVDRAGVFRVWRLRRGIVDELDDPFLSPIVPAVDPVRF